MAMNRSKVRNPAGSAAARSRRSTRSDRASSASEYGGGSAGAPMARLTDVPEVLAGGGGALAGLRLRLVDLLGDPVDLLRLRLEVGEIELHRERPDQDLEDR